MTLDCQQSMAVNSMAVNRDHFRFVLKIQE